MSIIPRLLWTAEIRASPASQPARILPSGSTPVKRYSFKGIAFYTK